MLVRSQVLDVELEPDDIPEYPLMEDEVHPHSIELLRFNSQRARVDWLLSV